MKVTINIQLKAGVLDPAGKATQHALNTIGFNNIDNVRIGKQIVFDMDTNDSNKAKEEVKKMCEKLLVNSVIEEYEIVL
ncbi:MAG: phosphoribosylformylglycinamidine synthase subunit PurS [Campylobacter sp.]|nr:phosphoribosylformylglycinamidine synthase subunit PurS [Campylobacter sp.]